jgi:hypothetical protein
MIPHFFTSLSAAPTLPTWYLTSSDSFKALGRNGQWEISGYPDLYEAQGKRLRGSLHKMVTFSCYSDFFLEGNMGNETHEKQSVLFATVKGILWGATLAVATGAVVNSIYRSRSAKAFKLPNIDGIITEATDTVGILITGFMGYQGFQRAKNHNHEIDRASTFQQSVKDSSKPEQSNDRSR